MSNWKLIISAVVAGISGALLVLVLWVAYQDHVAIREVVSYINQVNARSAQASKPAETSAGEGK